MKKGRKVEITSYVTQDKNSQSHNHHFHIKADIIICTDTSVAANYQLWKFSQSLVKVSVGMRLKIQNKSRQIMTGILIIC